MNQVTGASADAETGSRASTEPCSTVSALTGFDPARKSDVFQVQLDMQRRAVALDNGVDAAKALHWLYDRGSGVLNGSDYGADWMGAEQAKPYLDKGRKAFAKRILQHAIALALIDVEAAYASAIEARRAAATKIDAVHESAASEAGDAR